jgi:hypothetical protein
MGSSGSHQPVAPEDCVFFLKGCANVGVKKRYWWAGGMVQVIKHPPSKYEALSSNPSYLSSQIKGIGFE